MILKINEIKKYLYLLLPIFVLSSCGISVDFPKETLEQDIVKVVKENLNRDVSVYQRGTTLYVDFCLENFSFDKDKFKENFLIIQDVYSAIGKAPLNTDAKINYVVISAFDPQHQFLLRIYENVEDFRKYYWHFISREDFYERQLMETYQTNGKTNVLEDKHDITKEEFLARLIAAPVSALGLKFSRTEKDKIYYIIPKKIGDDGTKILLKTMIQKLADKNMKKYEIFSVKSAILLDEENNIIIDIPLNA
jgi:hypothetical protein